MFIWTSYHFCLQPYIKSAIYNVVGGGLPVSFPVLWRVNLDFHTSISLCKIENVHYPGISAYRTSQIWLWQSNLRNQISQEDCCNGSKNIPKRLNFRWSCTKNFMANKRRTDFQKYNDFQFTLKKIKVRNWKQVNLWSETSAELGYYAMNRNCGFQKESVILAWTTIDKLGIATTKYLY